MVTVILLALTTFVACPTVTNDANFISARRVREQERKGEGRGGDRRGRVRGGGSRGTVRGGGRRERVRGGGRRGRVR